MTLLKIFLRRMNPLKTSLRRMNPPKTSLRRMSPLKTSLRRKTLQMIFPRMKNFLLKTFHTLPQTFLQRKIHTRIFHLCCRLKMVHRRTCRCLDRKILAMAAGLRRMSRMSLASLSLHLRSGFETC